MPKNYDNNDQAIFSTLLELGGVMNKESKW